MIGGDLNQAPGSEPLKPLLSLAGLNDVLQDRADNDRWTYHSSSFGDSQLDYLLVSDALRAKFLDDHIERRGIFGVQATDRDGQPIDSLPGLTKVLQASDHGAVIARFNLL